MVRSVQETLPQEDDVLRSSKRRETEGNNTEAQWRQAVWDGTRYNYSCTQLDVECSAIYPWILKTLYADNENHRARDSSDQSMSVYTDWTFQEHTKMC